MKDSLAQTLLACLSAALSACAHDSLPADVARFVEQRKACEHAAGEFPDPPDPERVREVLAMISEHCTGTDAQLAALRERYRNSAAVTTRLANYESVIEKQQK